MVGGGTMGMGIAQVLVKAGARVTVSEVTGERAEAARAGIAAGLAKAAAGDESPTGTMDVVVGIPAQCPVDLAIEAVPEDLQLKAQVLALMAAAAGPAAVVASNTSSLSIDALAGSVPGRHRFLGLHFFNPVPRSALVEIVVGGDTNPATVAVAQDWVNLIGKESIVVRDSPGFATSRLGVAIGLEAIRMVEEEVATPADIDRGMVLGYRFPMGPLRLTDLVGLDVRLAIAEHLAETLGERFTPPDLLRRKVAAGELGKKSGRGFFEW